MKELIDIKFDFHSDTPQGKDPDSFSPRLRKYHQVLWSKNLPSGIKFDLDLNAPRLLHHNSDLGEYFLSSDAIGRTCSNVKKMSHIVNQITSEEMIFFDYICSTIGAYIIFPSKQIDKKMTINGARGVNHKIQDRFDLTLECIRRFYLKQNSPLSETFERYSSFFSLFQGFKGYIDFFLLQDLIDEKYLTIKFWHPFESFDYSPFPKNVSEYNVYKTNMIDFIMARNVKIKSLVLKI